MSNQLFFADVDPQLRTVFDELRSREPIFHTERFGRSLADFERHTAPDFWEVGASGRRYSRNFILELRKSKALVDADEAGWKATGFGFRQLGKDCYLLTYTLDQGGRVTRRATIWEQTQGCWRIVYHQGTVVTSDEDDALPLPEQKQSAPRDRL
jgi:hypothetical protein